MPKARSGSSSRAARLAAQAQAVAAAERPHDDHGDALLLGERQDPALDLALERVQRDLHRVEPAGAQRRLELPERARAPVRDADPVDHARVALLLDPVDVLAPGDEVVHLLDLDASEPATLRLVLARPSSRVARPDLRRDAHARRVVRDRRAERLLRVVHRRRVEHGDPSVERPVDETARECRVVAKGGARAEADDRAETTLFHLDA